MRATILTISRSDRVRGGGGVTGWEYLVLKIQGQQGQIDQSKNMLVTTSDGRHTDAVMPMNIMGLVNEMGAEGWEMLNADAHLGMMLLGLTSQFNVVVVFRRPRAGVEAGGAGMMGEPPTERSARD